MPSDLRDALGRTRLFKSVSPDGVGRFAEVGRVEHWPEGSLVLEEGERGPRMMVLLEGQAEVIRADASGTERRIAVLGPGEVLGEMSLLLDLPRTATVRATTALRVFAMNRSSFEQMVADHDPAAMRLGLELAKVLAERLMSLIDRVLELLTSGPVDAALREQFTDVRQQVFTLWEAD